MGIESSAFTRFFLQLCFALLCKECAMWIAAARPFIFFDVNAFFGFAKKLLFSV